MIQLSSLTKTFGDRVLLDAVTWQIDDRERVGLCGPNGAGKTTLLQDARGPRRAGRRHHRQACRADGRLPAAGRPQPTRAARSSRKPGSRSSRCSTCAPRSSRIEARLADRLPPDGEHETRARRATTSSGTFRRDERLQHRSQGHDGAARARLLARGFRQADRDVLRRLADAHRAGQAAARPAEPAAARRADQPPRPRRAQLARGVPDRLPARGHPRLARPLLPRRGRHAHHRDRPAHAHRLRRQLLRVHRRARRADGAAAPAEARPGRRDRAHAGVHQPVPLPGHQGVAGAEPHQDARQGRAHRDAARAQEDPLQVPRVREERPDGPRARRTSARPTATASSSTASTSTSSAATASPSSARTAPASRR